MSFQALSWASKQRVGNATGKAVLLMLANRCGNDDYSCYPSQKNIAEECECGVRTVVSWLQKFEEMGLIKRERRHRGDGSRTSDLITLNVDGNLSANNAHAGNARASDDNPTCTSCTPLTSQGNISSSLRSEDNRSKSKRSDLKTEFEQSFWPHYPRKTAKGHALKAFMAARKRGVSLQDIVSGVLRYADERDGQDKTYTKHPATWLNGECWLDEPQSARANAPPKPKNWMSEPDYADQALKAFEERHDGQHERFDSRGDGVGEGPKMLTYS